jgi:ketosteroid isomerase-like protein
MTCDQNPNCSIYQDVINTSDIERFTSTIWHTFYKKQEGQWILKHENGDLYTVQGDDDDIIDFSSTIELLDAAYIIKQYKEQIFNVCNELENIRTANVTQKGDITILQAQGNNTKTETVGCTISFDLWNNIWITNVSLF